MFDAERGAWRGARVCQRCASAALVVVTTKTKKASKTIRKRDDAETLERALRHLRTFGKIAAEKAKDQTLDEVVRAHQQGRAEGFEASVQLISLLLKKDGV
jgi:DNA-directed RNA polymerase subunit F